MRVIFNNQDKTIDSEMCLDFFLQQQNINTTKGIAVGVNNTVIPFQDWTNYILKENDKILVITAAQGG